MKNWKLKHWLIASILALVFGISLILNLTYIPKYLQLINGSNDNKTITIKGYDDINSTAKKPSFIFYYNTKDITLGQLLSDYSQTYTLRSDGSLLREIVTIKFYSSKSETNITWYGGTGPNFKNHIMIYQNNHQTSGIDLINLKNNDIFFLRFEPGK